MAHGRSIICANVTASYLYLYLYMCVYVYMCMHSHMNLHIHALTYIYALTHIYALIHICVNACLNALINTHKYTYIRSCINTYMCKSIYTFKCIVNAYIYKCLRKHEKFPYVFFSSIFSVIHPLPLSSPPSALSLPC